MNWLLNFGGQFLFAMAVYLLLNFRVDVFKQRTMLMIVLVYLSFVSFSIFLLMQEKLFIYDGINNFCAIFWATAILTVFIILKRNISTNTALYSAILITFYSQVLYEEFAMIAWHDIAWALGVMLVLVPFGLFVNKIKTAFNYDRLLPFIICMISANIICFEVYPSTASEAIDFFLLDFLLESLFMIARFIGVIGGAYFFVPATIKRYKSVEVYEYA